jgi:hypothetical protein
MSATIRSVEYYNLTVKDRPGEAYRLLSRLAQEGVSLLAFNAVPMGGDATQLVIYPSRPEHLVAAAQAAGLALTGPQPAFLIQGDDELGALVEIHRKLYEAQINVYSSSGVTDGRGGYGYLVHVRSQDFETAARVLDSTTWKATAS